MDLIQIIDAMAVRIKPPVDKLSPVDCHPCVRNMWLKHRNVKQLSVDVRKDLISENIKSTVRNWVAASGYRILERAEQLIAKTPDNQFVLLVLDVVGKSRYGQIKKHGPMPGDEHKILSALESSDKLSSRGNKLHRCHYVVVCRATLDMTMIEVVADSARYQIQAELMQQAESTDEIPYKNESYWCNWCDYKGFCAGNELANVNCGTCANMGEGACPFGSSTCSNHIYHPQLMECAGYTVQGADQSRLMIDYGDFINAPEGQHEPGRTVCTSKELYAIAGTPLIEDEVFMKAWAVFDGRLVE